MVQSAAEVAEAPRARRASRTRRTQEERSHESRTKLLAAAAQSLCDVGFSGTTVAEIAKRAGLSLGCLQHHFPEKRDLLAAAVEHVFEEHRTQLLHALIALPETPDRTLRALDLLWESMQSEAFVAYLELLVAARTDAALHAHVERTARRMAEAIKLTFDALYTPPEVARPFADIIPALVTGLLEAAMLSKIAKPNDDEAERMFEALKAIHVLAIGAQTPAPKRAVRSPGKAKATGKAKAPARRGVR